MCSMVKKGQLTAKQAAFIEYYRNPKSETYNNQHLSALRAGYAENTARQACVLILANNSVKDEIKVCDAKNVEKVEHNYNTGMIKLDQVISNLKALSEKGSVSANLAITAVLREQNEISGLHKQRFIDETEQTAEPLTQAEIQELRQLTEMRRQANVKLSDAG